MSRSKRAYKAQFRHGYAKANRRPARGGVVMVGSKIVDTIFFSRAKDPTALHQAWMHNAGREYEPNGKRERLRRIRQIRSGQLKAENGLVRHG